MEYSLEERRRQLYQLIRAWNQSRLDLFAISEPNQVNYYCVCVFVCSLIREHAFISALIRLCAGLKLTC